MRKNEKKMKRIAMAKVTWCVKKYSRFKYGMKGGMRLTGT